MDKVSVLFTTAEIAVAFAGFSGLASLLGRRHSAEDVRIDVMRLRAVLEGSLMVAAAAVLPVILLAYEMHETTLWRIASSAYLIVSLALVSIWSGRIRRAAKDGAHVDQRIVVMFYVIAAIMGTLLVLGILTTSPSRQFAFYLAALYAVLFGMAVLFLRLVASLVAARARGGE